MTDVTRDKGLPGAAGRPGEGCWEWESRSAGADADGATEFVASAMADAGYPETDCRGMRVALQEAVANAVKHGNHGDPSRRVRIRVCLEPERVLAEVEDEGEGFDPGRVADPRAVENLERPGGRGLLMMRHYTDWVRYNDKGNRVTLCRRRPAG